MQVSQQFQKVIGATLVSALVIAAGIFIATCVNPPGHVSAQNAGVVGIQAINIPVFSAQTTLAHSAIFQDIGQGVNILRYCNTSFTGSINLEWSPLNNGVYSSLQSAVYVNPDSNCHTLTVNGYFPQMRSTINPTAGSGSAWYSASSGPVGYSSPAVGSNGPSSPVACDENSITTQANGAGPAGLSAVGVTFGSNTTVICGFTLSFAGAPSSVAPGVEIGWATSGACSSPTYAWSVNTTSSTPQVLPIPIALRSASPASQVPCLQNLSGVSVTLSANYAIVQP